MSLDITITGDQVTFIEPPPDGSVSELIPNQQLQNVVLVTSSVVETPGQNQPPTASSFPYGIPDPWTVNPNLTQFYPVNAPPNP